MATVNGFIDRTAELNFILTKMDGGTRADMLGIKRIHYVSKERLQQLQSKLEVESINCSPEAKEKLQFIFRLFMY